jgi:Arc/MetJ-type ribon-helix-helix transcriptional regulator
LKPLSVKLTDQEHELMESLRGNNSKSDYIKMLINADSEKDKQQSEHIQKLFLDTDIMKKSLLSKLPNVCDKNDLLSLALFIVEVLSVANPSAYANQKDKLQDIYNKLKGDLENER